MADATAEPVVETAMAAPTADAAVAAPDAAPAAEAAPAVDAAKAEPPVPATGTAEAPTADAAPAADAAKEESAAKEAAPAAVLEGIAVDGQRQVIAADAQGAGALEGALGEIERLSSAKITVAPEAGADGQRQVTMTGTAIAVARAKVLVEDKMRGSAVAEKPTEALAESTGKAEVMLAGNSFRDRASLAEHVKCVQNSVTEGAMLGPEDSFFIFHLATYHPNFAEKMTSPVVGFKYAPHQDFPGSKCFFVVRADGTEDGVSISKCINILFPKDGKVAKAVDQDAKGTKRPREEDDAAEGQREEKKPKRENIITPGLIVMIEGVPRDFAYQSLKDKISEIADLRFLELPRPKIAEEDEDEDDEEEEEKAEEGEAKGTDAAVTEGGGEAAKGAEAVKDEAKEGGAKEGEAKEGEAKEGEAKEGEAKEGAEKEKAAKKSASKKPAQKEAPTLTAKARFSDAAAATKVAAELKDLDGVTVACKVLEGDEEKAFWERLWERAANSSGKDGKDGKGKGKGKKGKDGKGKGKKGKDKGKKGGKGKKRGRDDD